jgi:hypothetical protein
VKVKFIVQVYVLLKYEGLLLGIFFPEVSRQQVSRQTSGINYPVARRRIIEAKETSKMPCNKPKKLQKSPVL